jgi:hypothetical protein
MIKPIILSLAVLAPSLLKAQIVPMPRTPAPKKEQTSPAKDNRCSDEIPIDSDCSTNTRGTFCFHNKSGEAIIVYISVPTVWDASKGSIRNAIGLEKTKVLTIESNKYECVYDLVEGSKTFQAFEFRDGVQRTLVKQGDIFVMPCKIRKEVIE